MIFNKNRRRQKTQQKEQKTFLQLESMIKRTQLSQLTLDNKSSGIGNEEVHEIIVSLTSYDKRIEDLYITIESVMQQSLKADRIVLCLCEQDFNLNDLPAMLKKQMARGLEVLFCEEDLGPYTKYFYTLQKYPGSLVLTVDDDFIYPPYLIDQLYRAYLYNPEVIHCHRSHKMRFNSAGKLLPYKRWEWDHQDATPSQLTFPTGVGGVLYFPNCLDEDAFNKEAFKKFCPQADDVWLKAMSLKKGTLCAQVKEHRSWARRFLAIEGSQAFALKRENKRSRVGNDEKIARVFSEYALWSKIDRSRL